MTLDSREESAAAGGPVNLYLFDCGTLTSSVFAYTDFDSPITFNVPDRGDVTFTPIPIERSEIASSGSLDKSALTVRMPKNVDFANRFIAYPPSGVISLFVFQGHQEDGEYQIVWAGRVLGRNTEEDIAKFRCEPAITSLGRNILRRNWQYGCSHPLYLPPCNANKVAATTLATVIGVSSDSFNLQTTWTTRPRGDYTGGVVQWTNGETEIRSITEIVPGGAFDQVFVSGFTSRLLVGGQVAVSLGCKRSVSDCQNLHNNINNFGGFNYIPSKNPYESKL